MFIKPDNGDIVVEQAWKRDAKTSKGLEHSREERLRELGLLSPERRRLRRTLTVCLNII